MTDSNYDDNGLISNSNDDFDTALHQSEKIKFKPLQLLNDVNLDTGLTTDLDDDMFDDTDYEKLEQMDATIDRIRGRYGIDSVKRAAFVGSPIDHMSGGISREKRTVDYKKIGVN